MCTTDILHAAANDVDRGETGGKGGKKTKKRLSVAGKKAKKNNDRKNKEMAKSAAALNAGGPASKGKGEREEKGDPKAQQKMHSMPFTSASSKKAEHSVVKNRRTSKVSKMGIYSPVGI